MDRSVILRLTWNSKLLEAIPLSAGVLPRASGDTSLASSLSSDWHGKYSRIAW